MTLTDDEIDRAVALSLREFDEVPDGDRAARIRWAAALSVEDAELLWRYAVVQAQADHAGAPALARQLEQHGDAIVPPRQRAYLALALIDALAHQVAAAEAAAEGDATLAELVRLHLEEQLS